jgi:hypothetical protein
MSNLDLKDIWTAAAVLMGFQLATVSWRLNREMDVQLRSGGPNWLPPADYLYLLSLLVTALGVFVLPILNWIPLPFAERLLGISVILFAGYPFALFAHYTFLFQGPVMMPGLFVTWQEITAIGVTLFISAVYILGWFFERPSDMMHWLFG